MITPVVSIETKIILQNIAILQEFSSFVLRGQFKQLGRFFHLMLSLKHCFQFSISMARVPMVNHLKSWSLSVTLTTEREVKYGDRRSLPTETLKTWLKR